MRVIRPKSSPKMIRAAIHRHAYAGVVLTNTAPIPALLNIWTEGPAGPVLTWYGPDSERVELTGTVLTNWVTKATNLLQEEADAAPGVRVGLDLPPHWRTLVWALAVWNCGAEVVFPTTPGESSASGAVDVQVSAVPDAAAAPADAPAQAPSTSSDAATAPVRIAVALPALARQVDDLPPGAIDGAAELMSQPDVLVFPPEWDPQAPALPDVLHGELGESNGRGEIGCGEIGSGETGSGETGSGEIGTREAIGTSETGYGEIGTGRYLLAPESAEVAVRQSLAVWCAGGSVVLVADPTEGLDRIASQEDAHPLG